MTSEDVPTWALYGVIFGLLVLLVLLLVLILAAVILLGRKLIVKLTILNLSLKYSQRRTTPNLNTDETTMKKNVIIQVEMDEDLESLTSIATEEIELEIEHLVEGGADTEIPTFDTIDFDLFTPADGYAITPDLGLKELFENPECLEESDQDSDTESNHETDPEYMADQETDPYMADQETDQETAPKEIVCYCSFWDSNACASESSDDESIQVTIDIEFDYNGDSDADWM